VSLGIDELVSTQAHHMLNATSLHPATFGETYFTNFHKSLPVIDKDAFYWQLEKSVSGSHFSVLLLSVLLVAKLSPQPAYSAENPDDLYPSVKRLFSLLQSTGRISMELIQSCLLITSYEHCQALHKDAWLSIGACARMGQVLNLHTSILTTLPNGPKSQSTVEIKKRLWWGIVLLERCAPLNRFPVDPNTC